ncbi:SH3 domain-containing protein [Candidatus Nomurabacteria bacterium]|nr:SH3 domain-containing protein [Candidatus Nomurabacteria bacterium]
MYKFFSRFFPALLFITILSFGGIKVLAANQQITVGAGTGWSSSTPYGDPRWNAYVHLPSTYAANPNKDYPTIIFFPGLGEVGTVSNYIMNTGNASAVISNGPGKYISGGWNGNVTVDGVTTEFIVISLQTPAYPGMEIMKQKIEQLDALYRIDHNKLFFTGLSHGGWVSGMAATYLAQEQSDLTPAGVVEVDGVVPTDNPNNAIVLSYPDRFAPYATRGGKLLAFDQTASGVGDWSAAAGIPGSLVGVMNATIPGSSFNFLHNPGNHCCWNLYYGTGTATNTQPKKYEVSGCEQTIYEWMARQARNLPPSFGCGSSTPNNPPTVNTGNDLTIQLPTNSVSLNGSASDSDGTVVSHQWTVQSKPSADAIVSFSDQYAWSPVVQFINNVAGNYVFKLTATDNDGASASDTVTVIIQPAATHIDPIAIPGLLAYYSLDSDSIEWLVPSEEIRNILTPKMRGNAVALTSANSTAGQLGTALTFPANGYIALKQFPVFSPQTEYTVSMWTKLPSKSNGQVLLSQGRNGETMSLKTSNGKLVSTVGGSSITSSAALPTAWTHIALVNSNTTGSWKQTLYINGQQQTMGNSGTLTVANPNFLFLGASGTTVDSGIKPALSGGALDDIRLYTRALTPQEISKISHLTDNIPPTAYAEADSTLPQTGPTTQVTFSGSATDPDGTITQYKWSGGLMADGSPLTYSAATQVATFNLPVGQYLFLFHVWDNSGIMTFDQRELTITSSGASGRPIELAPTAAGTISEDLSARNLAPGTTIVIPAGSYSKGVTLSGIHGTADNPIIIRNSSDGAVEASSIVITDSSYFSLSGTGTSGVKYGFKVYGSGGISVTDGTSDYTIDHVEVSNALTGMTLKIDPKKTDTDTAYPNFRIKNVQVHDNWIHDVSGVGILAGNPAASKVDGLVPVRMNNLKIAYNLVENTGETAIQVTNARDTNEIHDNLIKNYGTKASSVSQSGIVLGRNTNGNVYNNIIDTGTGPAIQLFSYGISGVDGNIIKNVLTKSNSKQKTIISAEEASAYESGIPRTQFRAVENSIQQDFLGAAITANTLVLPSTITNNLLCGVTKLSMSVLIGASRESNTADNQLNTEKCAAIPPTPKEVASSANQAMVTASLLNVRQSASTAAPLVGKLKKGTIVTIAPEIAPGWTPIETASGLKGVVSSQYIDNAAASAKTTSLATGTTVQVTATNLNVRVSPSTTSRIVGILRKGQTAEIYAASPVSGWRQIRMTNGVTGYVSAQYVVSIKK